MHAPFHAANSRFSYVKKTRKLYSRMLRGISQAWECLINIIIHLRRQRISRSGVNRITNTLDALTTPLVFECQSSFLFRNTFFLQMCKYQHIRELFAAPDDTGRGVLWGSESKKIKARRKSRRTSREKRFAKLFCLHLEITSLFFYDVRWTFGCKICDFNLTCVINVNGVDAKRKHLVHKSASIPIVQASEAFKLIERIKQGNS